MIRDILSVAIQVCFILLTFYVSGRQHAGAILDSGLEMGNSVPESRIYHKGFLNRVLCDSYIGMMGEENLKCTLVSGLERWVKISTGPHPLLPYCHGGRGVSHSCLSVSDSWRGIGVAGKPLFLIRSISQWRALKQVHPLAP